MGREKDFFKNTVILSVGTVFPKVVHFIALPILTACLSKQEYGYYDLITTAVAFLLPIITLQIQSAAFRYLIENRENEQQKRVIVSNVVIFIVGISLLALFILYFVLYKFDFGVRLVICIYYFVDILIAAIRQTARGLGENTVYANTVAIESIVYIIGIFLFVVFFKSGLFGTIGAIVVSLTAALIYVIYKIKLYRYVELNLFKVDVLKELIGYSWPMIPNVVSIWVMQMSDRFVLSAFLGVEVSAIYAVANKLPALYNVVQNTFTLAWQENASIVSEDENVNEYYSKMFDIMYCLYFALIAMLIAITPILFPILVKGNYGEAYYQIPILYIGVFFASLSSYLSGIYIAFKETKKIGSTTVMAAACNLILDILLVNSIGIYAGSVSTLVSYLVLFVYRMIGVQRIKNVHYNYIKMLIMLSFLVVMGFLLYQNNIYLNILNVIIAIVLAIFYNYNILKSIIKTILKIKR